METVDMMKDLCDEIDNNTSVNTKIALSTSAHGLEDEPGSPVWRSQSDTSPESSSRRVSKSRRTLRSVTDHLMTISQSFTSRK